MEVNFVWTAHSGHQRGRTCYGGMGLVNGAVELPAAHLSARVAWHDTDWTGRVCAAPGANHSCATLGRIEENKDADFEEEVAGRPWADLTADRVPPCVFERAGFMRPKPYSIARTHPYSGGWTKSHAHFAETAHHMPALSAPGHTSWLWVKCSSSANLRKASISPAYLPYSTILAFRTLLFRDVPPREDDGPDRCTGSIDRCRMCR
jgi:hypothetical protein